MSACTICVSKNDSITIEKICLRCHSVNTVKMSQIERMIHCSVDDHCHQVAVCSPRYYMCPTCDEDWVIAPGGIGFLMAPSNIVPKNK